LKRGFDASFNCTKRELSKFVEVLIPKLKILCISFLLKA